MLKKIIALFLVIMFMFSFSPHSANAYVEEKLQQAIALKKLGLLLDANGDFALGEKVTRAQGAIMLVRLLGKEEEARALNLSHPFNDVPSWASMYVGYCYQKGLTSGVSKTEYGTTQNMTVEQYVTFILRALGYSDKDGDFTLPTSLQMATKIDFLSTDEAKKLETSANFLRDDLALISYNALLAKINNSDLILAEKMINDKVINKESLKQAEILLSELVDGIDINTTNNNIFQTYYYKGWLYFNSYNDKDSNFKRVRLNGTGEQTFIPQKYFHVMYGDNIFTINSSTRIIERYNLKNELLSEYAIPSNDYEVYDDWLYYKVNSDSTLRRINIHSAKDEQVFSGKYNAGGRFGDLYYFTGLVPAEKSDVLVCLNIKTGKYDYFSPAWYAYYTSYCEHNGYVYIVKKSPPSEPTGPSNEWIYQSTLCRTKLGEVSLEELFVIPNDLYEIKFLNIINDKIYYIKRNNGEAGYLMACNLDGTNHRKVSENKFHNIDIIGDFFYLRGENKIELYRYNYITEGPIQQLLNGKWN